MKKIFFKIILVTINLGMATRKFPIPLPSSFYVLIYSIHSFIFEHVPP